MRPPKHYPKDEKTMLRVTNLIGLALGSSDEQEQRSAALKALEMMRDAGMVPAYAQELLDETRLDQAMNWNVRSTDATGIQWRTIKSRFAGACCVCLEPIADGESIWWAKGQRARCTAEACRPSNADPNTRGRWSGA